MTLLALLNQQELGKITKWAEHSDAMLDDDRVVTDDITQANVVSSRQKSDLYWGEQRHRVLLDIDIPAYLVPSSTPGHSHLYIDLAIGEEAYFDLLDALAKVGIITGAYAEASKRKGGTFLRLPWVKKSEVAG